MALPAQPILASSLWATQQTSRAIRDTVPATGVTTIDIALRGCLQYRSITCISAQPNSGEQEVCLACLTSYLLSSPTPSATIIDTGSSFDLRKLYQTIVESLEPKNDAKQRALAILDRLKVMKVFDFEGLADAISELRDSFQNPTQIPKPEVQAPRGTVGDSEDEDEMLDDPSPIVRKAPVKLPEDVSSQPSTGLLLINNLDQLATPLIKTNHAQGQALLTSFMRSLSHLTKAHGLATIIISSTTSFANAKEEPPSAFASCKQRPALGKSFTHLLDTHLLLHQAQESNEARGKRDGPVSIIEVLHDRNGERAGRWAPFTIDEGGRLKGVT